MSFSIRLSDQEKQLALAYAKLHNISMAEAFKSALFERIEDEFDVRAAEFAYEEYKKDDATYSHDEVKHMLGFE